MSTLPPPPPPFTTPPVAPVGPQAPTLSAPALQPQVQPAPPADPAVATPSRRRRGLIAAGWAAAAVLLVLIAIVTKPSSGGKGETTAGAAPLTPVRTFTPQSLHDAVLATPFPAGLLPAGFTFDGQKSPQGKTYVAQGFSTPAKAQQHHSVGTAVVALSTATPATAYQITMLSFAEPASAEAYMQEARNATGVQAAAGQPVCGVVANGVIAGCSIPFENIVVEGRAKSTNGQPLADANAALATTNSLAQAGVTYVHQVKGG